MGRTGSVEGTGSVGGTRSMEETESVEREIDAKVRDRHNVSLPVGSEEKLEEGFEKY